MRYGFAVSPPLSLLLYFSFSLCLSTFLYARPAIPLCSLRHVLFLSAEVPVPPFHFVFFMFSSSLICLFPLPIYLSLSLSFSFSLAAGNSAHLLSLFNVVYLVRPPSLLRNFVRSFLLLCNGAFISSYPPVSHSTRARLSLQPASRPTVVHSPVFFYFATCIVAFLSSAFSLSSSCLSLSRETRLFCYIHLSLFSFFLFLSSSFFPTFFLFLSLCISLSLSRYITISVCLSLLADITPCQSTSVGVSGFNGTPLGAHRRLIPGCLSSLRLAYPARSNAACVGPTATFSTVPTDISLARSSARSASISAAHWHRRRPTG